MFSYDVISTDNIPKLHFVDRGTADTTYYHISPILVYRAAVLRHGPGHGHSLYIALINSTV